MLILFDIDGTLLQTQRAGVSAMTSALEELAGHQISFDGIEIAGRLDVLIWKDLVQRYSLDDSADALARFRSIYGGYLEKRLRDNPTALAMPGVANLVSALAERKDVTLGLLTGNFQETGRMKVRAAGFDPDTFVVGAWGDDGATRRDLPPVAMKRFESLGRGVIEPERVVIIGDTPHDIDCASFNGCRSIGVATGVFSVAQLEESGANLALPTLEDTDRLVEWMTDVTAGTLESL